MNNFINFVLWFIVISCFSSSFLYLSLSATMKDGYKSGKGSVLGAVGNYYFIVCILNILFGVLAIVWLVHGVTL